MTEFSGLVLDLRSDTLTVPCEVMKQVMLEAPLGDAFFDEDPSVALLEANVAKLFGKESALFVPTGTMGNQIALRLHCAPGDAIVSCHSNHISQYESGAMAALNGLQIVQPELANGFELQEIASVFTNAFYAPVTTLVAVENTHLRSGGRVYDLTSLVKLKEQARVLDLPMHMDGARIWNAHIASGVSFVTYGALFDSLSVCFSKGLGAPVGSCLLGTQAFIQRAKRVRKMFGGSMRQCGSLAAAANYAMQHNLESLRIDHENARKIAVFLRHFFPDLHLPNPETNIVLGVASAPRIQEILLLCMTRYGIKLSQLNNTTLRAVLHRSIDQQQLAKILCKA